MWNPEFEISSIYIDQKVDRKTAEQVFNGKFIQLENGKWFFPDFIQHQYPKGLKASNPAHTKVIETLSKLNFLDKNNALLENLKGVPCDPGVTPRGTMGMGKEEGKGMEEEEGVGKEKPKPPFEKFIEGFNQITGREFRGDNKSRDHFNARLKDGYIVEEILEAVKHCFAEPWHVENPNYLTPEFITRADKLEKYRQPTIIPINGKQPKFDDSPEGRRNQLAALKQAAYGVRGTGQAEGNS